MMKVFLNRVEEGHVGVYFRGGAMLGGMAGPGWDLNFCQNDYSNPRLSHDAAISDNCKKHSNHTAGKRFLYQPPHCNCTFSAQIPTILIFTN